jgi:hypothetical protein
MVVVGGVGVDRSVAPGGMHWVASLILTRTGMVEGYTVRLMATTWHLMVPNKYLIVLQMGGLPHKQQHCQYIKQCCGSDLAWHGCLIVEHLSTIVPAGQGNAWVAEVISMPV